MKTPEEKQLLKFSIFAGCIYLVQSTGSFGGLAANSIQFYTKEGLGWNAATMAYYFSLTGIAWLIKPLLGIISDCFPIYGYRRKSYIYITNILSILIWWYLAYAAYSGLLKSFWPITTPLIIIGFCFAVTDIAADGLTVEKSQATQTEADLQSIQWGSIYLGLMLTTVLSVWLAQWVMPDTGADAFTITQTTLNRLAVVFIITSLFPLLNLIACFSLVTEEKVSVSIHHIKTTLKTVFNAVKDKKIWILMLCIFMLHFSPGFGAPLFYYERDFCGPDFGQMPKMWFAWVSMWDKLMAIVGILIYKRYWKVINIKKWLYFSVLAGFVSTLGYMWIQNVWHILVIATIFGSFAGFIHVAFLTIAAQATPKLAEGVIFAAYCSVFNLANTASNAVGGWLFDQLNNAWSWTFKFTSWIPGISPHMTGLRMLLVISAVFTLLTIFFVPLICRVVKKQGGVV